MVPVVRGLVEGGCAPFVSYADSLAKSSYARGRIGGIDGTCCKIAWRMDWVMLVGTSVSGMLVVHLVFRLSRRSRPYAPVLKIGRVVVKEYGKVLSWEGITLVVPVMYSSSCSRCIGYVEFLELIGCQVPPGT